jgi:hypothetical protein
MMWWSRFEVMNVLYVPRDVWGDGAGWRRSPRKRAGNLLDRFVRRRRFQGQDGFIRGALRTRFRVTEWNWRVATQIRRLNRYDAVFVSAKSGCPDAALEQFTRRCGSAASVLVVEHDNASVMPEDAVLDQFDLILKREPYCDRDRYSISERNKTKIRPTMLSCPLVQLPGQRPDRWCYAENFANLPAREVTYDVSFVGADTNKWRIEVCDHLAHQAFHSRIGIAFKKRANPKDAERRARLATAKLDRWHGYVDLIRQSAVNLALDGYGQFTHRHLEIWALGGFMLSSPTIREIELPGAAHVEGQHYVAFDNLDDLVEKVDHYRRDATAREAIAAAGIALFKKLYDFERHGRSIEQWIRALDS